MTEIDPDAAELQDDPTCLVAGCVEPPVTHRSMRISVPIMGSGSDGATIVVDRQEQTIQAALCKTHDEMLKAVDPNVAIERPRFTVVGEDGPERFVVIDESTGEIG